MHLSLNLLYNGSDINHFRLYNTNEIYLTVPGDEISVHRNEDWREISDGKTPGPMTEINFWEAKCINLESLFEQVKV